MAAKRSGGNHLAMATSEPIKPAAQPMPIKPRPTARPTTSSAPGTPGAPIPPLVLITEMYTGVNQFALLALPMFVLTGELLNRLDGNEARTASLFASLAGAAHVAGPMLDAMAGRDDPRPEH